MSAEGTLPARLGLSDVIDLNTATASTALVLEEHGAGATRDAQIDHETDDCKKGERDTEAGAKSLTEDGPGPHG